jgi:hypothetical protein
MVLVNTMIKDYKLNEALEYFQESTPSPPRTLLSAVSAIATDYRYNARTANTHPLLFNATFSFTHHTIHHL